MTLANYFIQSADILRKAANWISPDQMEQAIDSCVAALASGRSLLVCGNGGSAADAMHIAGELVGRFKLERPALKVICLSSNPAVITAWANDYSYDTVFSRQVEAYAEKGGVLLGLSTSGNSRNVVKAFMAARAAAMTTIALTGEGGGDLAQHASIVLDVPSKSTPMIQQVHLCIYHYLCEQIEQRLSGNIQTSV
jgi:D-sedoheptulose 7-phosphate isomerase